MKKKDIILLIYILSIIFLFMIPGSRTWIENQTISYPYIMGFIKTSILATSGELIASRIATKDYFSKPGLHYRFIVWGFLGMGFVLMFEVYASGVDGAIQANLLPSFSQIGLIQKLYQAFVTSLIMNLTFAPAFMLLHRVTDTYLDLSMGKIKSIQKGLIADTIDWKNYFQFVLLKTIPFFWIPAHTITFLLPSQYRVLMAGFLSIALGLILSLSKIYSKSSKKPSDVL